MPRLPYPELTSLDPDSRRRLEERLPLNIYRMLCHAPTFFPGWMDLGRAVLYEAQLPARLRELAILRVGHLCNSAYELHQHRKIALAVGITPEQVDAVGTEPDGPLFDAMDRAVLAATDQLVRAVRIDDERFADLRSLIGDRQVMELVISVSFYMMVARVIENSGVPIEEGGGPSLQEVADARRRTLVALQGAQHGDAP
jgi:4-carboxymuconolactone decarboxylase